MRSLLLVGLLFLTPYVYSDYFLKFETSGAAHDYGNQTLPSNSGAWLKVSIVDTYPVGKVVHFPGSQIEAWPGYKFSASNNGYSRKDDGVNHTEFYVSDIPRSITLRTLSDGQKETVSFGDAPKTLSAAPAVLLPDQLVVAPGVEIDHKFNNHKIYIAAAMPVRPLVSNGQNGSDVLGFDLRNEVVAKGNNCVQGWYTSAVHGEAIEMRHAVTSWPANSANCWSIAAYTGKLSHRITFE